VSSSTDAVRLRRFKPWFWAAAAYNAIWGTIVGLAPNLFFDWLHIPRPNYPALFQCIGMMVGVYAIGYAFIAWNPVRFGAFVWIGLAGKVLGPLGFVYAVATGQLPLRFGTINIANDILWLPAFIAFAYYQVRFELDTRGGVKRPGKNLRDQGPIAP